MKKKVIPIIDRENCGLCKFFLKNPDDDNGYCRRFPPMPVADEEGIASVFAVTDTSDWCGEFRPKLNS
jgi:hypothetical protein